MRQHMSEALATGLSATEAAVLDFEGDWFTSSAPKDQLILERFGWSTARYYQVLNQLIDRPEALAHSPLLVKRLRRLRSTRQRERSAARLAR